MWHLFEFNSRNRRYRRRIYGCDIGLRRRIEGCRGDPSHHFARFDMGKIADDGIALDDGSHGQIDEGIRRRRRRYVEFCIGIQDDVALCFFNARGVDVVGFRRFESDIFDEHARRSLVVDVQFHGDIGRANLRRLKRKIPYKSLARSE